MLTLAFFSTYMCLNWEGIKFPPGHEKIKKDNDNDNMNRKKTQQNEVSIKSQIQYLIKVLSLYG
jgi:hypothetical protein